MHIPKKKSHYALAPTVMAPHEQLCRKLPCTVWRGLGSGKFKNRVAANFWSIEGTSGYKRELKMKKRTVQTHNRARAHTL